MRVLIDTGPLVALINPNEQYHRWVVEQARLLVLATLDYLPSPDRRFLI